MNSKEPMPQTIEDYRMLAARDLKFIMEQREEINRLKVQVNNLRQKLKSKREHL